MAWNFEHLWCIRCGTEPFTSLVSLKPHKCQRKCFDCSHFSEKEKWGADWLRAWAWNLALLCFSLNSPIWAFFRGRNYSSLTLVLVAAYNSTVEWTRHPSRQGLWLVPMAEISKLFLKRSEGRSPLLCCPCGLAATVLLFSAAGRAAINSMDPSGRGSAPVELHLQKQGESWIWPVGCSLPTHAHILF